MLQRALEILADLIRCDTQNPPRDIAPPSMTEDRSNVFATVRQFLDDQFRFEVQDFGDGRINMLAVRGNPQTLFNVHLDTVPVGDGWQYAALRLTQFDDRVVGRGVCDIKGAAACLIAAASETDRDVAILFSSDEEGANSCCIEKFCESSEFERFKQIVVAEPTGCRAVVGHRGYLSVTLDFQGSAGHTSQHHLLPGSANHQAVQWGANALQRVARFEQTVLEGQSACFNLGRIDGGIKNNMVADQCRLTFSSRLPSGHANQTLLDHLLNDAACDQSPDSCKITFDGASLPGILEQRQRTINLCQDCNIEIGDDVDFWTEAAIFAKSGKPTFVLGPGDIAQAHTADEWVSIEQLESCCQRYLQLMVHWNNGGR